MVGRRRLAVSHLASTTIDSLAGLANRRHKQRHGSWRQLGCQQPRQLSLSEQLAQSVLDGEMEVVENEEDKDENLPPVLHKAWEASRLRALNDVLGELQPGELLLEAVEAAWKGESVEVLSGEEVDLEASFAAAWGTSTKEAEGRQQRTGWSRQATAGKEEGTAKRDRGGGAGARQVEHARVQCRSTLVVQCW